MNKIYDKICLAIATLFGIGNLLPFGQGTLGAFFALLFVPVFLTHSLAVQGMLIIIFSLLGVWASGRAEKHWGTKDDHRIVIDEFVSIFITFLGMSSGIGWGMLAVGFLLNRALDIWKPFFVDKLQNLPGGWGIMLDDTASALLSRAVLLLF